MDIHCNAGVTRTNTVGDLPGCGTVWYHPNGIANILSLSRVKEKGYGVTYDSTNGNELIVHKSDGSSRIFKESERGLYFMDTSASAQAIALIHTVADNRSSYTNHEYSRAMPARKIQRMIGRPRTRAHLHENCWQQLTNQLSNQSKQHCCGRIFFGRVRGLHCQYPSRNNESIP